MNELIKLVNFPDKILSQPKEIPQNITIYVCVEQQGSVVTSILMTLIHNFWTPERLKQKNFVSS